MIKRPSLAIVLTLLALSVSTYNLYRVTPSVAEAATLTSDTSSNFSNPQNQTILMKTITEKIHPSLPEYTFSLYGHEGQDEYCISSILIQGNQQELVQELRFPDTFTYNKDNYGFYIEDLNFDGYKDLRIQEFTPAGPNVPYLYWTFVPAEKKFMANQELSMISSPIIDLQNKKILSYIRDGAMTHLKNYYQYIDGHLIQTKEIKIKMDPNTPVAHITIKELKNGIWVKNSYDKPLPIDDITEIE